MTKAGFQQPKRRGIAVECEAGQTCEHCGDLSPWESTVCGSCGWRLGAEQLRIEVGSAVVGRARENGEAA